MRYIRNRFDYLSIFPIGRVGASHHCSSRFHLKEYNNHKVPHISFVKILLLALISFMQLDAAELEWQKDLATAFEKSATEHKPLMVLVEKTHCRWCTKMKEETLQDENISKRLKQFIIVKVHKEEIDPDVIPYAKLVPTIYFLDHNKKILESVIGYYGVLDFNSWIDDAQGKQIK